MIAAVTTSAIAGRLLGNRVLLWIGTRSYGLYLYHWPIYQMIRDVAGNKLDLREFVVAMVLTCVITELSYRYVETPIRKGQFTAMLRRARTNPSPRPRRALAGRRRAGARAVAVRRRHVGDRRSEAERGRRPRRGRESSPPISPSLAGLSRRADVDVPATLRPRS